MVARRARLQAERDGDDEIVFPNFLIREAVTNAEVEELIFGQRNLFFARLDTLRRETDQLAKRGDQITDQVRGIEAVLPDGTILASVGGLPKNNFGPDMAQFKSGRDFAAWLGLVPRQHSSGGKERLGRISKMGDRYIRRLMVVGMTSRIKQIKSTPERFDPWFAVILQRKPAKLAAIAMANKTARIIWAVLARNAPYTARTV